MPKYNLPNIDTKMLNEQVLSNLIRNKKFLSISKAAKFLQVSPDTLRNWEKQGKLVPTRTIGGARRYNSFELSALKKEIQPFLVKRKGLLTVSQAAEELGVSPDTLRSWTKRGLIDSQRTKGGARRFTRLEIKRVQAELGIEPKPIIPVTLQNTKFQPEINKFSIPWKIISNSTLIVLILIMGLLLKQNIDSYGTKVTEVSGLVARLAKNIESLQSGVYGIQTEMIPSPSPTSSPSQAVTYIQTAPSLIQSASSPITLDKGVIGCKDCLTSSLNYLSSLENSDGSLNVSTVDKVVKISLQTNHTNNWSVNQAFGGGAIFNGGNVGIGTTSPNALLQVNGNVGIGATTSTNKLDVWGNTRLAGNLTVDGSVYSNPADLAEMYDVYGEAEEGDLVELVSNSKLGFATQKATNDSGNKLIGVISTKPGSVLGYDAMKALQKPVALAGRVPVKVSDENGPIKVGDYLTSSSVPGVAAKAKTRGVVIGQALESFEGSLTKSDDTNHLYYRRATIGKILSFINVSFADPGNFFASLSFDSQGNLIVPKLKAGSIVLDPSLASAAGQLSIVNSELSIDTDPNYAPPGPQLASNSNSFYDLSGEIASLEERVRTLESQVSEQLGKTQNTSTSVAQTKQNNLATQSAILAQNEATSSASASSKLDLTPPDILIATSAATLAKIEVTDILSSDKLFNAQDGKISGELNVFGKTTLANTTIAGDLTVDGTLALNNNSINVIGSPTCSEDGKSCGILYVQSSPLAYQVNFFNGLVTINKLGNLRAQSVIVSEFRVVANKISGSGKIEARSKSVDIENLLVKPSSRILITPSSETNLVLAVTEKIEGKKFTVSSPQITDKAITFDWFMVGESL